MKTSKRSASKKKPANPRLPQCNKILKLFIKLTGIPPDRAAGFKVRQLSEDLSSVAYTSYGHSRIVPLPPALVEPLKKHLEALPHPDERPLNLLKRRK